MKIGVPKEIKNHEYRVGLTPAAVWELSQTGHEVLIEKSAGDGSGFQDEDYAKAGALTGFSKQEVYAAADMVVKVKEPLKEEYPLIREGQVLFTYFHFAASLELTRAMLASKAVCIAYETVQKPDGSLPLLAPMSEVAGRMAAHQGAKYLEKTFGGKGLLMGGVPGVLPAKVLVLGGGTVGTQSARIASGMGAHVTMMDISLPRLRYLDEVMPPNVQTVLCNEYNIRQMLPEIDVLIGAVLVPGAGAPKLITRDMLSLMKPGTVLVDVAVDQGGCFATTHPTTHQDPIFLIDHIVHYCVANMPGAVPHTSTQALVNATTPYVKKIAQLGWEKACKEDVSLAKGLSIAGGQVLTEAISAFLADAV